MPIFPSAKVNLHLAHNTITANNYSPNNSMENNYSTNNDCVGVGPWTGMISSYNKSNKTAIIEDTETRKIIEFTYFSFYAEIFISCNISWSTDRILKKTS